jgi:peptidyl-prolyl cis-trans isomerase D
MGLLVVSFAIWGINDIFRGFGRSTFAQIGRTEISIDQFQNLYRDRLQQVGRQIGKNITLDQARAAGLDRRIVSQIMSDFVIDERARQLGLAASDSEISRRITSDPTFQSPNGQFDRQRFEYVLRQTIPSRSGGRSSRSSLRIPRRRKRLPNASRRGKVSMRSPRIAT